MHAVILAGGAGSRLWPVSTRQRPKPFIKVNNESFIQKAFIRAIEIESVHNIITVTTSDCVSEVKNQYNEITNFTKNSISKELIAEPCGRDTAAAIAVSAVHVLSNYGPDEMMLILPSDHIILDSVAFSNAVMHAQSFSRNSTCSSGEICRDVPSQLFNRPSFLYIPSLPTIPETFLFP